MINRSSTGFASDRALTDDRSRVGGAESSGRRRINDSHRRLRLAPYPATYMLGDGRMLPMTLNRADPFAGGILTLAVVSGLLTSTLIVALTLVHL